MALVWRDQLDGNGDPTGNRVADSASVFVRSEAVDYGIDKTRTPEHVFGRRVTLTGDPALYGRAVGEVVRIFFHTERRAEAWADVVETEALR